MAWIAAVCGFLVELIVTSVTNLASTPVTAWAVLAVPALLTALVAYEWWNARRYGLVLRRVHLTGVGLGLVLWFMYPTSPSGSFNASSAGLCEYAGQIGQPGCMHRADVARLHSDVVWWSTGALILVFALLARRSRTAAWSSPVVALGGAVLALHLLEVLVRSYTA